MLDWFVENANSFYQICKLFSYFQVYFSIVVKKISSNIQPKSFNNQKCVNILFACRECYALSSAMLNISLQSIAKEG